MTKEKLREIVLAALTAIAPETKPAALQLDMPLQEQLDLDSYDFLRFMIALHERTGVDVPERDYGMLRTVNDAIRYLDNRLADPRGSR